MKVRRTSSGRKLKSRGEKSREAEMPEPSKTRVSRRTGKPKISITSGSYSLNAGKSGRKTTSRNIKQRTPAYARPENSRGRINRTQADRATGHNRMGTPKPESREYKTEDLRARLAAYRKAASIKPEITLWLDDGRIVRNIKELSDALKNMDDEVFAGHHEKKDLSDWMRDVLGHPELAADFDSARDPIDAFNVIEKFAREEKLRKAAERKKEKEAAQDQNKPEEQTDNSEEEFLEIQKAIKKIAAIPGQKRSRLSREEREKMLLEKEKMLEEEEKRLDKRRIEAARKRSRIIEQREILEREKFEEVIRLEQTAKKHGRNTEGIPKLKVNLQYTETMLMQLLDQTRKEVANKNPETARQLLEDIKKSISIAGATSNPYSRKLEYEIMSLEVDIKLAALNH